MNNMHCFCCTMHIQFNWIDSTADNQRKCCHCCVDHRCRNPHEINSLEIHIKCTAHTHTDCHKYSNKKFCLFCLLRDCSVVTRISNTFELNEKHKCKTTHWTETMDTAVNSWTSMYLKVFSIVSLAQFFFVTMRRLSFIVKKNNPPVWCEPNFVVFHLV